MKDFDTWNAVKPKTLHWIIEAFCPTRCVISGKLGTILEPKYQNFVPAPRNKVSYTYLDDIFARTKYYDPVVEKVIEHFKFRHYTSLAPIIAQQITQKLPTGFINDEAVFISIPLHWRRQLFRGYNQSHKIAKELQKHFQNHISKDLKRIINTNQQAKLKKESRIKNLEGAFVWKGKTTPRKVILIDDVVSSGSTLDQAAKTLKQSGVKEVKAIVFARGGK